jgi:GT2 family glycosyltransferase
MPSPSPDVRTTVVVATRNRRPELLTTLERLASMPERPPVIVVDNGSDDGTPDAVRDAHPTVDVVELDRNRGLAARNVGVALASTAYVAFSDDDSWWAPGSLSQAANLFEAFPRLGLLAARIVVGPEERLDPVSHAMASSPLPPEPDLPGPPILGFVACGAVVRRRAYFEAGGFDELLFFYGEESLLALDLVQAGWGAAYVEDVVAHHHPSPGRDGSGRRGREVRNAMLSAWMRRPWPVAMARTAEALVVAPTDRATRHGVVSALLDLPAAIVRRGLVSPELEWRLRLLEEAEEQDQRA